MAKRTTIPFHELGSIVSDCLVLAIINKLLEEGTEFFCFQLRKFAPTRTDRDGSWPSDKPDRRNVHHEPDLGRKRVLT